MVSTTGLKKKIVVWPITSMFLRFHPGLNLQSQFNLDNVTVFNKNEQETTLGQKVTCYNLIIINILN